MSRGKGYTLAEVLSTVVILAILAGIAIPNFSKSKAKAEAAQAIAYLRTIRTAEKMYFAKNNVYSCQGGAGDACGNAVQIKSVLGAEVGMNSYTFSVAAAATTFTATATGSEGTIILNQAGTWSGTYAHIPAVADV